MKYTDTEVADTSTPKDEFYDAQQTWLKELEAAHREWEDFHERGDKILEFYTDDRKLRRVKRYPLFNANVSILENALFAQIPEPHVSRRFKDPDDNVGRVASLILQRALVTELSSDSSFKTTAKSIIKDMLVPGLGVGWVRYEADVEDDVQVTNDENAELANHPEASPVLKDQSTPIDYVHWKDFRMSPCRTWNECRWVARRVFMDESEATKRFGERAEYLSFSTNPFHDTELSSPNEPENMIEPQAEVWEIWCKAEKKVYFICETCPTALDIKDDFLGLPEFFPTEKPLVAHTGTSSFIPLADYTQLQDQYNDLNETNNRISRLVKNCRVAGVYDEAEPAVKLIFEGAAENNLVPIKNFQGFAERGGLKGAIDLIPVEAFVATIAQLNAHREVLKQQIYELTGISDIVRGASSPYETAAAQGMKAQYASIRLQGKQSDVAEYLTGLIRRKAHLMVKFYTPERLLARAGALPEYDQQFVPAALQLLQNDLLSSLKLEVSSDQLQQPNWAKDQQEKAQTITALSQLLSQAIPAAQQIPELAPLFLHLIKWSISGNPGAKEIEGVVEMGLQQAMKPKQQEEGPTPEQQAAQQAMQMKQQELQAKQQLDQQELQMKQQQATAEIQLKREQMLAELQLKREVEMAKATAKQVPQVLQGNMGMDEEQVIQAIGSMQQTTVQAIAELQQTTVQALTALAAQEPPPAQVIVQRAPDGSLIGTIQ
jgi:hypothetical protein